VTYFLWILFAGAALAQTAATPPNADKTVAPSADKASVATSPNEGKPPAAAKPAETFQSSMEKQRAAMATQREAMRKQSEMAVQWQPRISGTISGIEDPAADCAPVADPQLTPLIESAAKLHQVEPKLIRGVIEQESAFRPCAISAKGAKGLMQLMPDTIEQFKVGDVFDPKQNIEAGATFLRQLLDKYKGDLKLALAAYNAGPGSVDKTGGIPDIKETQDYVEGILKRMR
jgi:soluble lytic murein transglycosylase-like protein